jgi:hypothetical protein
VQAFPSLHEAVLLTCTQPELGLHESFVHTFPSSQFGAPLPTQLPPAQASTIVQTLPSSQGEVLFACRHPVDGLQLSSVHTFPSEQSVAGPPWHVPPPHVSPVVHGFPSSHVAVLFVWTHPVTGSQLSSVQTSPSSQFLGGPPTQTVPEHVSETVHTLSSSHWLLLSSHAAQTVRSTPDDRFPQLPRFGSTARTR